MDTPMELNSANISLLRECRELVTSRLQATVARAVDEAAVTLEREMKADTTGLRSFDAVRELRQRRREFALCFDYRLRELFDRSLRSGATAPDPSPATPGCRTILMEIDRRLDTLLPAREAQPRPNPLNPQILMAAFNEACAEVTSGEPVRHALMELFQRHMQSDLPRIYGEVNALLARQGISAARPARRESAESSEPFSTFPGRRPQLGGAGQPVRPTIPGDPAVQAQIETQLKGHEIPHFVSAFALGTWAQVMTRLKMDKGEGSAEWNMALKTLDDFIAGIESFSDPLSRRLAVWKLPGLVQRLKTGMGSIGIPQQEQLLFLKTLRAYHLRVLGQRPIVPSLMQSMVD